MYISSNSQAVSISSQLRSLKFIYASFSQKGLKKKIIRNAKGRLNYQCKNKVVLSLQGIIFNRVPNVMRDRPCFYIDNSISLFITGINRERQVVNLSLLKKMNCIHHADVTYGLLSCVI